MQSHSSFPWKWQIQLNYALVYNYCSHGHLKTSVHVYMYIHTYMWRRLEYDQADWTILLYSRCTRSTYKSWGRTPYPWTPRLRGIIQLSRIGNVLRNIWLAIESLEIVVRLSLLRQVLTPGLLGLGVLLVQEVHTETEVVHLTPGLLGLGVLFNCHA